MTFHATVVISAELRPITEGNAPWTPIEPPLRLICKDCSEPPSPEVTFPVNSQHTIRLSTALADRVSSGWRFDNPIQPPQDYPQGETLGERWRIVIGSDDDGHAYRSALKAELEADPSVAKIIDVNHRTDQRTPYSSVAAVAAVAAEQQ